MNMMGVTRRTFIKIGATGSLSALALDASSVFSETSAPAGVGPPDGAIRIAVVQMETVPGAVDKNRAKALAFAAEALKNGADIVLFHEELLVGYATNLQELAEPAYGPTSQAFQSVLAGTQSFVLWGLTEKDAGTCYIAANLVSASGVQANYRKTHLWWHSAGLRRETSSYKPGNELVTFAVKGHKCGVMICYDGDFPETTRCYANLGCGVLFWLNNRTSRGHNEVCMLARANSIIMPTACCCGRDELLQNCPGGSNITNHDGTLLTDIWNEEGVIYADVRPDEALQARADNPMYKGRRPDIYARYV
jgi:predicted amidohydrolase